MLSFLSERDLANVALLNRQFKRLAEDDAIWRLLSMRYHTRTQHTTHDTHSRTRATIESLATDTARSSPLRAQAMEEGEGQGKGQGQQEAAARVARVLYRSSAHRRQLAGGDLRAAHPHRPRQPALLRPVRRGQDRFGLRGRDHERFSSFPSSVVRWCVCVCGGACACAHPVGVACSVGHCVGQVLEDAEGPHVGCVVLAILARPFA